MTIRSVALLLIILSLVSVAEAAEAQSQAVATYLYGNSVSLQQFSILKLGNVKSATPVRLCEQEAGFSPAAPPSIAPFKVSVPSVASAEKSLTPARRWIVPVAVTVAVGGVIYAIYRVRGR